MAAHSSILAWRISWTEEPGRLQSIGLQKVKHNGNDLACMQRLKKKSIFKNKNMKQLEIYLSFTET